jgi:hypothetical protein
MDRMITYSTNDGLSKTMTYDKLDLATVTDGSLGVTLNDAANLYDYDALTPWRKSH